MGKVVEGVEVVIREDKLKEEDYPGVIIVMRWVISQGSARFLENLGVQIIE
jgi:hypothetical protein